ncbi:hypothetical protein KIN20_018761 [Parelaphostrongylus tenuis]|uniref:Uncharacterized protein n=1 Tax=Parelaphostrongylus tenuis TaxID=148309 RepID=A0AAD5N2E8_PARTN|nr:hypothetical protein KIN20_018761 [Parelaphostrongylus tenuis]
MLTLVIYSTVFAITIAAPPIAPYAMSNDPCVDGVNNVFDLDNVGNENTLYIRVKDVIAQTYDANGKPSCYNGRASIQLPGMIKLVNGTLIVTKAFDLEKSGDLRLTVTKDSIFVGTVCKDGVSESGMIPSSKCHHKILTKQDKSFVDMISNPGTYDLQAIEKASGRSNIVRLPPIPSAEAFFVTGDWEAQLTLVSESQTIADIKMPSNTHWIYIK